MVQRRPSYFGTLLQMQLLLIASVRELNPL